MELRIDEISAKELLDTGSFLAPQYPNVTFQIGKLAQTATKRYDPNPFTVPTASKNTFL